MGIIFRVVFAKTVDVHEAVSARTTFAAAKVGGLVLQLGPCAVFKVIGKMSFLAPAYGEGRKEQDE